MFSVRMLIAFEKTERVRHVGHLDLMRAMQRALRRSGLPIRYSQGFNPHVLLAFASPLPVGVSGAEELMEVSLEEAVEASVFADTLRESMPTSLPLLGVRPVPDQHPKLMAMLHSATYRASLMKGSVSEALAVAIPSLLTQKSIPALRKTKSGERPCDIRPMLYMLARETIAPGDDNASSFVFRVALTEKETLKADLLFSCLAKQAGVEMPPLRLRRITLHAEKNGHPIPLMEY